MPPNPFLQQLHVTPSVEPQLTSMSKVISVHSDYGTEKPKRHINPLESLNRNDIVVDDSSSSICLTAECVKSANDILVNIDESVSPCDDFYKFACGNFDANTIVPDDKSEVTVIGSLTDKLHQQIRVLLEDETLNQDRKSSQLVKNLYSSCSNRGLYFVH
jgi:hypothetical protein